MEQCSLLELNLLNSEINRQKNSNYFNNYITLT